MPQKHPSGIRSLTPNPFPKEAATIPIKQNSAPTLEHASNTENLQSERKIHRTSIQQITPRQQTEQEARQLLLFCAILKSEWPPTNHAISTSTTLQ
jgi:hypothetical protein